MVRTRAAADSDMPFFWCRRGALLWCKTTSGIDNHAVRRWAEANGIELSKRRRIPQDVVSQFSAAGN
jgi:hypothetical protein